MKSVVHLLFLCKRYQSQEVCVPSRYDRALRQGTQSNSALFRMGSSRAVIPKLGYAYPPEVRTRTFRGTRKNWIMAGKCTLLGYLFTVTTYKFQITATILITNILLIWRVQFMEIGCQGVRKWKKKVGNHCSRNTTPAPIFLDHSWCIWWW